MPNPFENEPDEGPDFVLEKEIASYERSNRYDIKNVIYSKDPFDGKIQFVGNSNAIKLPKQFVFNPDARVKDYDKLIKFLLDNTVIQENAIGFDKVRYMFKEVE